MHLLNLVCVTQRNTKMRTNETKTTSPEKGNVNERAKHADFFWTLFSEEDCDCFGYMFHKVSESRGLLIKYKM